MCVAACIPCAGYAAAAAAWRPIGRGVQEAERSPRRSPCGGKAMHQRNPRCPCHRSNLHVGRKGRCRKRVPRSSLPAVMRQHQRSRRSSLAVGWHQESPRPPCHCSSLAAGQPQQPPSSRRPSLLNAGRCETRLHLLHPRLGSRHRPKHLAVQRQCRHASRCSAGL